jgi:hypothetical protein
MRGPCTSASFILAIQPYREDLVVAVLYRLEHKYGKPKVLSVPAHKLGRAVCFILRHRRSTRASQSLTLDAPLLCLQQG